MKREWGTLQTLLVAFILGTLLTVVMFVADGVNQNELTRDKKLDDGSQGSWRDKVASVLYSPGQLHAAHFKSEINCQNCHSPAQKVKSDYCISCHSKADFTKNTKDGVLRDSHFTFIKELSCFTCHTEHKGLGGRISQELDLAGHQTRLGKALEQDCKQCHTSEYKIAHPDMINKTCEDCHKLEEPFSFKSHTFRHIDVKKLQIDPKSTAFVKLPYPDKDQCEGCHLPKFHVGEKGIDPINPASVEGGFDCLSCHNFNMKQVGIKE